LKYPKWTKTKGFVVICKEFGEKNEDYGVGDWGFEISKTDKNGGFEK